MPKQGYKQSVVHRKRLSKAVSKSITRLWEDPGYMKKQQDAQRGKKQSPEAREKNSKAIIKKRKDPEYVDKLFKGQDQCPNKSEKKLEEILHILAPDEYAYNGNYNLRILLDGLVPDFVNVNGQKKVIDFHGNWHKGEDLRKRASRYAKCRFKSLIVWQAELRDLEKLQDKLIEFLEM
jgi:hypothetical protein